MTRGGIAAQFIEGGSGRLFVVMRTPHGSSEGAAVLIVPPFAEEMNKCRRMLVEVAQQLASLGIATVFPDLYGTGDSEGEFADADAGIWLDDLRRAAAWSGSCGWEVRGLLCTRIGCTLGARYARTADAAIERSVFWQPATEGDRFLNQFLRLRVAASLMDSARRESVSDLRATLEGGEGLEVSGYWLPPRLARQLDAMLLEAEAGTHLGHVHWIETVRDAAAELPTSAARCIERLAANGVAVEVHRSVSEPYWSSTEIVVHAPTIAASVEALAGLGRS